MLIPYLRQSRKRERTISIVDQHRDIQQWAERNNVELAAEVVEQGVSGSRPWRDRDLGAALAACEAGAAEGVVVAYQSRLSRESGIGTAEVWEALQRARARLVCVAENIDTARDDDQEFNFGIQALIARQEWKRHRANFQKGKHSSWEAGVYVGSAPAGFDTKPLRKNQHADQVGRALTTRANGGSWSEVARAMRGVPTTKGETLWSTQACRAIARNRIYRGEVRCTCGCGGVAQRAELAVVTGEVWDRAQPAVGAPQASDFREVVTYDVVTGITRSTTGSRPGSTGRQDRGSSLLAGLLVCGGCGRTMSHATTANGKYRFYRCRGGEFCDNRASAAAGQAEALMKERALAWFQTTSPAVGHDTDLETVVRLEQARDDAVRRLEGLVSLLEPGDPGARERLTEAREAAREAEIALLSENTASRQYLSADTVAEVFARAPVSEQRLVLRAYIDKVTVTPGRGEIAERIGTPLPPLPARLR